MSRNNLKQKLGKRQRFTGKFLRWGVKQGWNAPQKTMLLGDIMDANGKLMTDHLWFTCGKWTERLGELSAGDRISFDARVTEYEKGYKGHREDVYRPIETDYRLSNPSKAEKLPHTGETPS